MHRSFTLASYMMMLSLGAAGCAVEPISRNGGYEYRHAGQAAEQSKLDERDAKIAMLEGERRRQAESNAQLQSQVQDLEGKLAAQEVKPIAPVTPVAQAQQGLVRALRPEIEKGDITVDLNSERLLIKLASAYLFSSGQDELKPVGVDALTRIGKVLKDYQQYKVEVAGHTDNVPIGTNLQQKFADNQALSTARAKQGARVLQEAGVDPSTLTAHGYGDTRPLATNADEDGRRKNRRVEIRVTK
jgi:chemotaxis protein MotB